VRLSHRLRGGFRSLRVHYLGGYLTGSDVLFVPSRIHVPSPGPSHRPSDQILFISLVCLGVFNCHAHGADLVDQPRALFNEQDWTDCLRLIVLRFRGLQVLDFVFTPFKYARSLRIFDIPRI